MREAWCSHIVRIPSRELAVVKPKFGRTPSSEFAGLPFEAVSVEVCLKQKSSRESRRMISVGMAPEGRVLGEVQFLERGRWGFRPLERIQKRSGAFDSG